MESNDEQNIYDYSSFDIEDDQKDNPISLSKYKGIQIQLFKRFYTVYLGKILLIVITATYCVYTAQYPYLNELKNAYSSENFEILAFPCNQFGLVSDSSLDVYLYLII